MQARYRRHDSRQLTDDFCTVAQAAEMLSLDAAFWTADDRLYQSLPRTLTSVHRLADYGVGNAG